MKRVDIALPDLGDAGESMSEAKVSAWLAETGAWVEEGDDLLEVTTDKAAFVVPSPQAGRLVEYCVVAGDAIVPGGRICVLETA